MRCIVARYGYIDASINPDDWRADGDADTPLALLAHL